jgi:hypothetical protein
VTHRPFGRTGSRRRVVRCLVPPRRACAKRFSETRTAPVPACERSPPLWHPCVRAVLSHISLCSTELLSDFHGMHVCCTPLALRGIPSGIILLPRAPDSTAKDSNGERCAHACCMGRCRACHSGSKSAAQAGLAARAALPPAPQPDSREAGFGFASPSPDDAVRAARAGFSGSAAWPSAPAPPHDPSAEPSTGASRASEAADVVREGSPQDVCGAGAKEPRWVRRAALEELTGFACQPRRRWHPRKPGSQLSFLPHASGDEGVLRGGF